MWSLFALQKLLTDEIPDPDRFCDALKAIQGDRESLAILEFLLEKEKGTRPSLALPRHRQIKAALSSHYCPMRCSSIDPATGLAFTLQASGCCNLWLESTANEAHAEWRCEYGGVDSAVMALVSGRINNTTRSDLRTRRRFNKLTGSSQLESNSTPVAASLRQKQVDAADPIKQSFQVGIAYVRGSNLCFDIVADTYPGQLNRAAVVEVYSAHLAPHTALVTFSRQFIDASGNQSRRRRLGRLELDPVWLECDEVELVVRDWQDKDVWPTGKFVPPNLSDRLDIVTCSPVYGRHGKTYCELSFEPKQEEEALRWFLQLMPT